MSTPSEEEARAALTAIINDGMADRGYRVNEWPEDEAAAYRIDGWAAGAARARSLQVSKTVDRVMSWLASRVSTPPSPQTLYKFAEEMLFPGSDYPVKAVPLSIILSWAMGALPEDGSIPYAGRGPQFAVDTRAVSTPPRAEGRAEEAERLLNEAMARRAVPVLPTEPGLRGAVKSLTGATDAELDELGGFAAPEPETLAPMSPVFEEMLTDDEWVERRLAAPTEPEEKR